MTTLTVTTKGQVTLKKDVLKHLGIEPGQQVSVDMLPGGKIELRAARPKGNIADAFGVLKREGQRPLTIDEINGAAADGWAGIR